MSFDKEKFSGLLKEAKGDRSINQYAMHSGISAAHISRLMRGLLDTPPNPDTIKLLAEKAYNAVSYNELMKAAGHFDEGTEDIKSDWNSKPPELSGKSEQSIMTKFRRYVARKDQLSEKDNNYQLSATEREELVKLIAFFEDDSDTIDVEKMIELDNLRDINIRKSNSGDNNLAKLINKVIVAGQEITLTIEELMIFNELKKHPVLFNDLATDPERKIKELLKLYEMKKMLLEEDTMDYGNGFGELKD